MKLQSFAIAMVLALGIGGAAAEEQPADDFAKKILSLPWETNTEGDIASVAKIKVPTEFRFLSSEGTNQFLQLTGNLPEENSYTFAPQSIDWFAILDFDPIGYVRDDETIDQDALLKEMKDSNEANNEERKKRNLEILTLEGWSVPPHYDTETHRLEWGTKLVDDSGDTAVNYTIKLLGRGGVVNAVLVSSPETLDADVAAFKKSLEGFTFLPGQRYFEFKTGDKVAAYGLTALIVGGAAAAAAKSGLFKVFGKFIAIGVIAVVTAIGGFLKRLFRRPNA
jgi:uncharacterized membrane-anchored protein